MKSSDPWPSRLTWRSLALPCLLLLSWSSFGGSNVASALELNFGIGTRQTVDLGYEQRTLGDPFIYGGIEQDIGSSWRLTAAIQYTYTRKFFVPEGDDDHSLSLNTRLYYEPGDDGMGLCVGTRTSSLYTSRWDKQRSGADICGTYRMDGTYHGRWTLTYHTPDEDDVWGMSVSFDWDQDGLKWFNGMALTAGWVQFPSPLIGGEELEGYTFGISLNVREHRP